MFIHVAHCDRSPVRIRIRASFLDSGWNLMSFLDGLDVTDDVGRLWIAFAVVWWHTALGFVGLGA